MMNIKEDILDPVAEIEKHPKFKKYSDEFDVRVKLAVEVHQMRNNKNLSQQKLAKIAETTQKVISKIEGGNVNVGIDLLQRIARKLDFSIYNWANIFDKKRELQQLQQGSFDFKITNHDIGCYINLYAMEIKSSGTDTRLIKTVEDVKNPVLSWATCR